MKKVKIGVVGLGYVGFPLACLFSKRYPVVGYDLNRKRVDEINSGMDATGEVAPEMLTHALQNGMKCTTDIEGIRECNVYVVAVPTPVDKHHAPDSRFLESASEKVGQVLSKGDTVIYESTVYPGMTEDTCVPVLERVSGMTMNNDFFIGYSPERINPGDKLHTVEKIKKITSGSTPETAQFIDDLYNSVLENGTFKASSIKVAEAAKIIENSQRDVNIAFMNEIAMIFGALGIDTTEVIEAASTKWNFLPFKPGLVGGHCISVDPYYLIEQAQMHGIMPRLMTETRLLNNAMGNYVAKRVLRQMCLKDISMKRAAILLLGFTFKENCPDLRNTKVIDIYHELHEFSQNIDVLDTWADPKEVKKRYGLDIMTETTQLKGKKYDTIVLCVNHKEFMTMDIESLKKECCVIYDVKGCLDKKMVDDRL